MLFGSFFPESNMPSLSRQVHPPLPPQLAPTKNTLAHAYCTSLGGADYFIGIVIASLSFGAMLAAPIFAKVTDRLVAAKVPIQVGMIFSIVGGLLYTFIQNKYVVVVARFIAGIGWGLEGAFMGQIGRTFSMQEFGL